MTDTASTRLAACPCGALPAHGYMCGYDDEEGYGYVECHEGGLSVVVHAATEAEAIAAWNERSTPPSQDKGEALAAWEPGYRPLEEGEIILATDEVQNDDGSWKATICAGQRAPDPAYPAHRVYRRALSTAQASEREQIVAWLREWEQSLGHVEGGALWDAAAAIERGDYLATPVEPSPADMERVARAVAESCHVDLSVAIHEAGGITKAIAIFGMDGISDDPRYKDWRIPSCRGVMQTAHAAIAALQSPPVEQPAQAEAQQPGDGLVEDDLWSEEVCRLVDDAFETVSRNPSDHETAVAYRRAILAALKARTSNETVELLREAREAHWFYYGDDCSSDRCRFGIDECISEDFEWDNAQEGDHVLQISGARPVPDMWVALHYFTEAEKDARNDDEPYTYTVHETEAEARAAIDAHLSNTPDQGSDQHG